MEPTLRNSARERLEAGELALGRRDPPEPHGRHRRDHEGLRLMTGCFSISSTIRWISTSRCRSRSPRSAPGSPPIVRVPAGQFWLATRVLDGGALGIVMPHVDTVEEAREIADRLR